MRSGPTRNTFAPAIQVVGTFAVALGAGCAYTAPSVTTGAETDPVPLAPAVRTGAVTDHVVILSVDGLRPDAIA